MNSTSMHAVEGKGSSAEIGILSVPIVQGQEGAHGRYSASLPGRGVWAGLVTDRMLAYKAKESVPSPDIVRLAEEDAHVVLAILQALGPAARMRMETSERKLAATMKPSHIAPLYSWLSLARVGPRPYTQNGQARKEAAVAKQEGRIPFLKPGRCQDIFLT